MDGTGELLSKSVQFVGYDLIFPKADLVHFIDCALMVSNEDQECDDDPFNTFETIGYLNECREKILYTWKAKGVHCLF